MIPFDGASAFGRVMLVLLGAAFVAIPYVGLWLFIPVGIAGYFILMFYNALEARDLRDIEQDRKRKNRRQ